MGPTEDKEPGERQASSIKIEKKSKLIASWVSSMGRDLNATLRDRQTDRQTKTDRQRETNRQKERQTERQT